MTIEGKKRSIEIRLNEIEERVKSSQTQDAEMANEYFKLIGMRDGIQLAEEIFSSELEEYMKHVYCYRVDTDCKGKCRFHKDWWDMDIEIERDYEVWLSKEIFGDKK